MHDGDDDDGDDDDVNQSLRIGRREMKRGRQRAVRADALPPAKVKGNK
jgi:hypothetical protein